MSEPRYKDFDAAVAELEPIRFRVAGREYVLEQEPSAKSVLTVMNTPDDADADQSVAILVELLGKERYDRILADGASLTQVFALCRWLIQQCGIEFQDQNGKGDDDGPKPNRAAKRSASKKSAKVGAR